MEFRTLAFTIAVGSLTMAAPVLAQTAPNPVPSVDEILQKTPEAKGVFVAADHGNARHVQSGLVCPPAFARLNLWHLEVFAKDGTDVGCDYGRNGENGKWVAKLTIFATKAQPGLTVDDAFAGYSAEIKKAWPDAKATGPAVTIKGAPPAGLENIRSEEYTADIYGQKVTSDLIVAVKNGWVIEIRMSTSTTVSNGEEAGNAVSDLMTPIEAMTQAQNSIGAATGQ